MGYYELLCQTELSIFVRLASKMTRELEEKPWKWWGLNKQRGLNYNSMEIKEMQSCAVFQDGESTDAAAMGFCQQDVALT